MGQLVHSEHPSYGRDDKTLQIIIQQGHLDAAWTVYVRMTLTAAMATEQQPQIRWLCAQETRD